MREVMVRPELLTLDRAARDRVLARVAQQGGHCGCCGAREFDVGDALFLGFLFLDEDRDAYMVALTCRNPECAKPRTAIILHEKDFLSGDYAGPDGSVWRQLAGHR
ncbi:hypothetical protein MAAFP003_1340 [Mycobacterium ahvazicum]|uniref:Uncharacterized protein n=1 Tax=Mycobacterium ahvazicum TaxID=1964395 RepID=A0A2K4Y7B2_9MYCO|nr:hypothetical protein [Mycobacterium ahvazicum]SOX52673.1 hypothetical protein MAAFP003_1340 [Mycobacterium ahvazicum]